jgi:hypothetical protein
MLVFLIHFQGQTSWRGQFMCARVGNQQSRGVVIAWVQTDAVRSLRHQRRDLHQLTYPVPLRRSGLILL